MKILLVSYYFPPFNTIGAVRTGKLAKYWHTRGHDVKIISAAPQPLPNTLPIEVPLSCIHYSKWLNINGIPIRLLGNKHVMTHGYETSSTTLSKLGALYKCIINFPDGQIGWIPFATHTIKHLHKIWTPDFIYASSGPPSTLIIAAAASRRMSVPWFAEFRDLWTDNHTYRYPRIRLSAELILERKTISTCQSIVTVSKPLANTLKAKYNKPIIVVQNGFDPNDYLESQQISNSTFSPDTLNIVYTGSIFPGQDASPLFKAIQLSEKLRSRVRIHFFGRYLNLIRRLLSSYDIADIIAIHEPVSFHQSLQLQRQADILLLLLRNSPSEHGVFTGKLFEYLGSRRPILLLGYQNGVAANLVKERKAGISTNNIYEIQRYLEEMYIIKDSKRYIPDKPQFVSAEFTRDYQFDILHKHIMEILP